MSRLLIGVALGYCLADIHKLRRDVKRLERAFVASSTQSWKPKRNTRPPVWSNLSADTAYETRSGMTYHEIIKGVH